MNDKNTHSEIKRRGFIGAALLAAGAAAGVIARRAQPITPANPTPSPLASRFAYDISEFEKTDPTLLRYRQTGEFQTGFERVTRLALGANSRLLVAGDESIKAFDIIGAPASEYGLGFKPHCVSSLADETIVCARDFFVRLDAGGREVFRSEPFGAKTYVTAAAARGTTLFLADAGNRQVLICDRRSGALIDRFGQADGANPGFAIPSPYFDLHINASNRLLVANSGRLRIETYSLDGRFESAWGEAGMRIDRFCGCCNPVYFTLAPNGDVITSEKGLARINIYSQNGEFKAAVAGPETLVENKELARRATFDAQLGTGFDVAVDAEFRVFALDPFRKSVRVFTPLAPNES